MNDIKKHIKLIESFDMIQEESDGAERLMEIKEEIKELLHEAKNIVAQSGDERAWARAKSYWYGHIVSALDKDHEYMGSSMVTMQDTIDELGGSGNIEDAVAQVEDYMNEEGVGVEEAVEAVADGLGINYNELMSAVRRAMG